MKPAPRHPLVAGAWVVALGTLASRVLGMVRDVATAALLGMSGSGAMDAFVLAFRIPNTFRRLFGEGALAASYLPVLAEKLEHDRRAAWQLASVTLAGLGAVLLAVLAVVEAGLAAWWLAAGQSPRVGLLVGLAATMMPYMVFICLAAQAAATLHALGHFSVPALAPAALNVFWIAGALVLAPRLATDEAGQAYVLAGCVLAAGVFQLAVQWPVLRRLGFRFDFDWAASRQSVIRIAAAMVPMTAGLAATQVNTLLDSVIAWGLARTPGGPERIAGLGLDYPMEQGAAAAVYYGERLYQFPLGILGLAVATAIFPLLSRHAARGDRARLGADLTLGLRLVLFLAVPASLGLVLLSGPLARLLFERGRFHPEDTVRAARVIACYGAGTWAYCALPVIVRGFYALGDRAAPVRSAAAAVGLNAALNLVLIWTLAEAGLAVATAATGALQAVWLTAVFSRRRGRLGWQELGGTGARTLLATAAMGLAAWAALGALPDGPGLTTRLARVAVPLVTGMIAYAAASRALRAPEWSLLVRGPKE